MGCDIHIYVETRTSPGEPWRFLHGKFPNTYYKPDQPRTYYNSPTTIEPFNQRNYALFSVLADVRNGTRGREHITPIASARGLPPDISSELLSAHVNYTRIDGEPIWLGNHSQSYLGLTEVLAYDWDQPFTSNVGRVVGDDIDFRSRVEPLREAIGTDWFNMLIGLADAYTPGNVRFVFGFDS